jgi:triosephosphate isomerase
MNGLASSLDELAALKAGLSTSLGRAPCDVLVCPPATLIAQAALAAGGVFAIGGQDCSSHASGAFTGEISAAMLKDAGASAVILGHSERRQYHGETDAMVLAKALVAWDAGLSTIICVGESEAQHQEGKSHHICHRQIAGSVPRNATGANTAIAYEPIWAIGTGKTPITAEIAAMHSHLRRCLVEALGDRGTDVRILYGGSVKPSNAAEILNLPEINGALVGGASLKADDFLGIIAGVKPL